ncbi:MAG: leucine-rich repeat protein [Lachnospiraceae bacterium]|nr:leucine-rich repeat protein [Lachnospiraceae bacterium]
MKHRYRSLTAYFLMLALLLQPLTVQAADVPTAETEAAFASEMPGEPAEPVSEPEQAAFSTEPEKDASEPENGSVAEVPSSGVEEAAGGDTYVVTVSGMCGVDIIWEYSEQARTLYIHGKGKMNDFYHDVYRRQYSATDPLVPWNDYKDNIEHVSISGSITYIGKCAFADFTKVTGGFPIPATVTEIGDYAFRNSSFQADELDLSSVKKIQISAFEECQGIKAVKMGAGLELFREAAFKQCHNLTKATINEYCQLKSYGETRPDAEGVFSGCEKLQSADIPGTVIYIGCCTFEDCTSLVSAPLPDGLKIVGHAAFKNCSKWQCTSFPENIARVEYDAFLNCIGLNCDLTFRQPEEMFESNSTADIPIGASAFKGCTGLTGHKLTIYAYGIRAMDQVGDYAFSGCGFSEIHLPTSLCLIGIETFKDHQATTIVIPHLVNTIWKNSFQSSTHTKFYFRGNRPLNHGGGYVLGTDYLGDADCVTVYYLPNKAGWTENSMGYECHEITESELKSVLVPSEEQYVEEELVVSGNCGWDGTQEHIYTKTSDVQWELRGNKSKGRVLKITGSGNMFPYRRRNGSAVTDPPEWFQYNTSIVKVEISDEVTSLCNWAFYKLYAVTGEYPIPAKLESMGSSVFERSGFYSKNLVLPETLVSIKGGAFSGCPGLLKLTVPKSVKKMSGGDYYVSDGAFAETSSAGDGLEELVFEDGLPEIGDYAVNEGSSASNSSSRLKKVTIPGSVKSIGKEAFKSNKLLEQVSLGEGIESIGEKAFYECKTLNSIDLPEGLKTVSKNAFTNCALSGNLTLPSTLTDMQESAFYKCGKLDRLVVLSGIESIPASAFYDCQVRSLSLPEGLISVSGNAFYNHRSSYLVLPSTLRHVSNGAFSSYSYGSLKSVYFKGDAPEELVNGTATTAFGTSGMSNSPILYYLKGTQGWADTLCGYTCVAIEAEDFPDESSDPVVFPPAYVKLDQDSIEVAECRVQTLKATVYPTAAVNQKVIWSSKDPKIAEVNQNGKVTGVSEGETVIFATTESGGKTAECSVKVTKNSLGNTRVEGVNLCQDTVVIKPDQYFSPYCIITPKNAVNTNVKWTSTDTNVANYYSSIKGIAVGTAVLTVTTEDGDHTDSCNVTVREPSEGEVLVNGITAKSGTSYPEVEKGQSLTITPPDFNPANATNQKLYWMSYDPNIASVDQDGTVTGYEAGTVMIRASTEDGGKYCTYSLKVKDSGAQIVRVNGVTVNPSEISLKPGESTTLIATVIPSNATDRTVTWTSYPLSVATVDPNGKVTAVSSGNATITVKTNDGNKTATCVVRVKGSDDPGPGPAPEPEPTPAPEPTPTPSAVQYTLTFKVSDNVYKILKVNAGETADEIEDPTGDGQFVGWYLSGKLWDRTLPVYEDATIVAQFIKASENVDKPGESSLDTQPEIRPTTSSLKLVKGQKFTLSSDGWKSTDSVVVAVKGKNVTAKKAGSASLQSESQTINITVVAPSLPNEDKKLTLIIPETKKLQPKDAGDLNILWVSSAPDVASVASDGTVMAMGAGKAKIMAYVNGVSLVSNVTVKEADASKRNFTDGGLIKLVPLQTIKISAKGFKPKKAVWTSSRPGVSADSLEKGVVFEDDIVRITKDGKLTAIGAGQTTLTSSGAGRDLRFNVEVSGMSTRIVHINKGSSKTLKIYGTKGTLAWIASKDGIVKINKNNKIKGIETGKTELTAKYKNFTVKVTVYVEEPKLTNPELTGKYPQYSLALNQGDTVILKPEKVYHPMLFKSSKNSTVFVNEAGILTARAKGKAKLTAVVNKKTVTVTVTVK